MAYTPIRSGFTGPSAKIGGSSDYHIDLKMLESLPIGERVKAVDSLARKYASIGREIEFSNQGVAGQRWNPEADLAARVDLLNRAGAAHSKRPGWQSLDFYVPFKGKSRFDKGAVEDASIFLPGVAGGSVRRGCRRRAGQPVAGFSRGANRSRRCPLRRACAGSVIPRLYSSWLARGGNPEALRQPAGVGGRTLHRR